MTTNSKSTGMASVLRNYEYISRRKIEIYHPQVTGKIARTTDKTVKLSGGIATVEMSETSEVTNSHHSKIEEIVEYLEKNDEIGELGENKPWVRLSISARAILHYGNLFFISSPVDLDVPTFVVVSASTQHLLGAEYSRDKLRELGHKTRPVGHLGIECFEQNSNTLGYARLLERAYKAEKRSQEVDYKFLTAADVIAFKHELDPTDIESLEKRKLLNDQITRIWAGENFLTLLNFSGTPQPKKSFFEWMLNFIRVPVVKLFLGKNLYKSKMVAMKKKYVLENLDRESLSVEDDEILRAAYSVATSRLTGHERKYYMVARRILSGTTEVKSSGNEPRKIEIVSPLFLASK